MEIRQVKPEDALSILSIYAPYVANTVVSFEIEVPSLEDFKHRIETISQNYPYLVCECDREIIGFAYATKYHERAAYKHSAEVSIYVADAHHGKGIGKALYTKLFENMVKQNLYTAFSGITIPNEKSVALHKSVGFTEIGVCHNIGYKLGNWRSVLYLEKSLREYDNPEKTSSV